MHEYVHPSRVTEVTPERKKTEYDDFAEVAPEYVAKVIDLSANVIYVNFHEDRAA